MQRPSIKMYPSIDKDGATYYVGRMESPISLKLRNGFAFIFYPDIEPAELHFCPLTSPDLSDVFEFYKERRPRSGAAKHGNLPVELHMRKEKNPEPGQEPRKFYIGKISVDGEIDCSKGIVFLAFIADPNEEELQIATFNPKKSGQKR